MLALGTVSTSSSTSSKNRGEDTRDCSEYTSKTFNPYKSSASQLTTSRADKGLAAPPLRPGMARTRDVAGRFSCRVSLCVEFEAEVGRFNGCFFSLSLRVTAGDDLGLAEERGRGRSCAR